MKLAEEARKDSNRNANRAYNNAKNTIIEAITSASLEGRYSILVDTENIPTTVLSRLHMELKEAGYSIKSSGQERLRVNWE